MDNLDYDPNNSSNLLKFLRLSNIFAPSLNGDTDQTASPQNTMNDQTPNQSNSGIDINSIIQKLMSPNEEMFNRMKSEVDSMPLESNFKNPSLWTKIRAHLAAGGADNPIQAKAVREGIEHEPYLKALSAWKQRLEPTEKLAQFENTRNVNDRLTGTGILRDEQTSRRQAETERKNKEDEDRERAELKVKEDRAKAYIEAKKFAQDHPENKPFVDRNGKLWLYNPTDPKSQPIDTGLEKLSDMEKIDLGVQGQLEEIQARGKVSAGLESQRQGNRLELESTSFGHKQTLQESQNEARANLKRIPSGNSAAARPQSETQKKQGLINKANEILSKRSDLRPYIIIDKNGARVPPLKTGVGAYLGGPTNEKLRNEAYNLLFGQEAVPGFGSDKNVTPQSTGAQKMRKEVPGHPGVFAVSTDGGKTWKVE